MVSVLPTVKLQHRRTGRIKIVNVTAYQANIGAIARDWKILSVRGGDAPDAVVREAHKQWEIEQFRKTDPEEMRVRGDARRAQEQRHLGEIRTEPVAAPAPASSAAPAAPQPAADAAPSPNAPAGDDGEDWRAMRWFAMRSHVARATGTVPRDKEHAEELMKGPASCGPSA